MKVMMTADCYGCPDGIKEVKYIAGETYEIPEDLAKVFIKELKVAVKTKKVKRPEPKFDKAKYERDHPKKVKVIAKSKKKSKKKGKK